MYAVAFSDYKPNIKYPNKFMLIGTLSFMCNIKHKYISLFS